MSMNNHSSDQKKAAIQMMAMDILENVLQRAEHPGKLADYLTSQMREILGGKKVVLMECISTGDSTRFNLISTCPERALGDMLCPELHQLAELTTNKSQVELWGPHWGPDQANKILAAKKWNHTIVLPLVFNERRVGVLFVFELYELHNVDILQNTLQTLMRVIALVLKNSFEYDNLEKIIAARTRQIEENERRFRTLAEALPTGIFRTDASGYMLYVNAAWSKMIGYSRDDALGNHWLTMVKPVACQQVKSLWDDFMVDQTYFREPFEISRSTGQSSWVLGHVLPEYNEEGMMTGCVGTVTDITNQKEHEKALQEAKEKAETANLEKAQFLANMSHETRTPLNGLMGMIQLLELTELSKEQEEYIRLSKKSCDSLLAIIGDILQYSTIEAQKIKLNNSVFSIRELTGELYGLFKPAVMEKGLRLTYDLAPDVPSRLFGDAFRLRQVMTNLLGNAIKFTHQGEIKLTVEAGQVKDQSIELIISVKDTGIGIPAGEISRLFDRFYQVDSSNTRAYGGTGLGLAISKGLVEMLGGDIQAKSKEGEGSCFSFTCPVKIVCD